MIRQRSRGFTLLEVTLAVLVGIVLLAGSAAAFTMYRQQAMIQQAKTELQQVRSQLSMAEYRQGIPCSTAIESVQDPGLGSVSFLGWEYYEGAPPVTATSVTTSGSTTTLNMGSTANFWTGQLVEYWAQVSGQFENEGTAVFKTPSNESTSESGVQLINSTISPTAPSSGYLCSGLMCNLAGLDANGNPMTYLSLQLPPLQTTQLPNGAGLADPFLEVSNLRIVGQTYTPPLPATIAGTNFDFQYVPGSPDNSADFGGLAMDVNCNVEWVLPSTASTGVSIPSNLPNLLSDPPVNW